MLKFLTQPYPFDVEWRSNLRRNAIIGCFVAFFLITFEPFGTEKWHDAYKVIKLMGYGVVAFIGPTLLLWLLFQWQKKDNIEKNWIVAKEIGFNVMVVLSIAFGNMLYGSALGLTSLSLANFVGFIFTVLVIGVFPISVGIILRYNQLKMRNEINAKILSDNVEQYQKNEQVANNDNVTTEIVTLIAENEKDVITLKINELLYIESADNYVQVVFLKNGKIQKELLRGSMKRFENQLSGFANIARTHRSFIANLNHNTGISGNAQGYRMTIAHSEVIIPIARNYGAAILDIVRK
jgi:LytTr DNA-binding domain